MTALLDVTSEWFTNIDDGLLDSAIYLDPPKAFDTVDHKLLPEKLEDLRNHTWMHGLNHS